MLLLAIVATLLLLAQTALAGESVLDGTILDEDTGKPVVGANVTMSERDDGTVVGTARTGPDGGFEIRGYFCGTYVVLVQAEGYENLTGEVWFQGAFGGDLVEFNGRMSPVTGPGPDVSPGAPYLQYGIVAVVVVVASLVMYSKIKRENLLRHAVRRRIYEYIQGNPGQHYRAILNDLDLPMGVLTYHLNRLEKGEYLRSRQDGMYRRFFVAGRRTEARFFLSDIQESIIATIRAHQGISQSKIAEDIGVSRKVVNYHVKILNQAGLLYVETRGRETACFAPKPLSSGVA